MIWGLFRRYIASGKLDADDADLQGYNARPVSFSPSYRALSYGAHPQGYNAQCVSFPLSYHALSYGADSRVTMPGQSRTHCNSKWLGSNIWIRVVF